MSVHSNTSQLAIGSTAQRQKSSMPDSLEIYKQELANAKEFKALRILQSLESRIQDGGSSAASSTTNGKQNLKPPPFVACTLCRQCKAKCVISDPASGQCDRCKACRSQCVFEGHKRGRKRTRGVTIEPAIQESGQDGSHVTSTATHPLHITSMDTDSDEDEDADMSSPNTQTSQSAAHPLQLISGSSRPLSLKTLLNPTSSGSQERAATKGSSMDRKKGDIVSRGIISLEMARKLFDFFFQALNPIILLFDSHLHTFDYIRSKSSFLFTTILSSAARFIAPSISSMLSTVVAEYSVQAIFGSRKTVETVQGWMMVYFWKSAKDKRAWTYVGLVCRTATEIGLDNTPMEDEPGATELQQRERRNCARTWMLTFMMDRAMASTVGRVIAGFTELRLISSMATDELTRGKHEKGSKEGDVTRKLLTMTSTNGDRFGNTRLHAIPLPRSAWHFSRSSSFIFAVDLQHSFNGFGPGLFDPKVQQAERYCLDLARQSLFQLKTIYDIDANILYHSQDSVSIMVAYAACFLRALLNSATFNDNERSEAFSLIAQTSDMFKRFSENTETTAALQADFLQSLAHHTDQALPSDVDLNLIQGFQDPTQVSQVDNDWLSSFMQVANLLSESNGLPNGDHPVNSPNPPNALLPQELYGTNLAELSDVDWDPVSASRRGIMLTFRS
uniref:Zn(2)-C6 fungal-type domain-containing protein n=1 Tax=Kwoniella bestiolae CBS 10118 TaxID=1296100 RepID=A0A1B9G3U1_9TREE|nr:hypothetical protein I302_05519 [Kwoniella bestiolae CBS 10118]OCF25695.1 hypothetical protein I302_05519 [Kwoniella bestiolae CBS 10118]